MASQSVFHDQMVNKKSGRQPGDRSIETGNGQTVQRRKLHEGWAILGLFLGCWGCWAEQRTVEVDHSKGFVHNKHRR